GYARTTDARGLAPHALAPAVGSGQSPPNQRRSNLTRPMWTAHVGVRVVHVDHLTTQRRALDYGACGLNLSSLRHKHDLACRCVTGGSGPLARADGTSAAPRLGLSARAAAAAPHDAARG